MHYGDFWRGDERISLRIICLCRQQWAHQACSWPVWVYASQINIKIIILSQDRNKLGQGKSLNLYFSLILVVGAYKIILLQEEMSSPKFKLASINSGNAQARCPPIAFRTILRCRNNSLEPTPEAAQDPHRSTSGSRASIHSNSSSHFRLPPANQRVKTDQDCLSKRSEEGSSKMNIKDMQSSVIATPREANTSRIQQAPSSSEEPNLPSKQGLNFEELEKRIDGLVHGKLQRYKLHKKGVGLTNWGFLNSEAIKTQLEEILKQFRASKFNQQGLSELSARVELIEKMMASEAIECELIKVRYHGFKSQRCNIASFHGKPHLEPTQLFNQKSLPKPSSGQMLVAVSNFISTNRQAFSKPSKESYTNTRYKHPAYSPNRQVLPRSCYSTQFLRYGVMPTFDCRQIGLESLPAQTSLAVKASAYQVEFKERPNNSKPVDFRELDCYRDKFKNPNISFMNHCKRQMLDASSHLKKTPTTKMQPKVAGSKLSKLLSQTSFNDFYKSQHRRNYHGHSGAQSEQLEWVRGTPKNGNLHSLTTSLRQSYLRG